jgi:hypothetical protein
MGLSAQKHLRHIKSLSCVSTVGGQDQLSEVEVIQSGAEKVHLTAKIDLFNVTGEEYSSEEGLWIVIKKDDRWGIRARSDF